MITNAPRDAHRLSPEFSASSQILVPKLDAETTGHLGLRDELMRTGPVGISGARGKWKDGTDGRLWAWI